MDKRRSKRKTIGLKARLVSRSINYSGYVRDFSEEGICVALEPSALSTGIPASVTFIVEFDTPSGETLSLQCRVARSQEGLNRDSSSQMVAMEIIGQRPTDYDKFLQSFK